MPRASTKARPKTRAKGPKVRARRGAPQLPRLPRLGLQPHQLDMLGLGPGGRRSLPGLRRLVGRGRRPLGAGLEQGLRWLIGVGTYVVPAALVLLGALVLAARLAARRAPRAHRRGLPVPGPAARPGRRHARDRPGRSAPADLDPRRLRGARRRPWGSPCTGRPHAGLPVGAHIAALFLSITGVLLLSGATVAGLVRSATAGVADTSRALRERAGRSPRRRSGSTAGPPRCTRLSPTRASSSCTPRPGTTNPSPTTTRSPPPCGPRSPSRRT